MYIDISLSRSNTEVCDLKIGKLETIKIDTIRYNIKEGSTFTMNEHHLYGSSRLGMEQKNEFLAFNGDNVIIDSLRTTVYTDNDSTISTTFISSSIEAEDTTFTALDSVWIKNLGWKKYELSNHLGNVMTVISDRKLGADNLMLIGADSGSDMQNDFIAYTSPFGGTLPTNNVVGNDINITTYSNNDGIYKDIPSAEVSGLFAFNANFKMITEVDAGTCEQLTIKFYDVNLITEIDAG